MLPARTLICNECQTPLQESDTTCDVCGFRVQISGTTEVVPAAPDPERRDPALVKTLSWLSGLGVILFYLFALGILLFGAVSCLSPKTPATVSAPVLSSADLAENAYFVAQEAVKQRLKAPATADFPLEPLRTAHKTDGAIELASYVDAENSFGANLRLRWYCKLRYTGPGEFDFQVEDLTMLE